MGRPTLSRHRKFRRLAAAVGSRPLGRGLLEQLLDAAYEAGDEYIGDSTDVEAAAGWEGAPGLLTKAFLEAGGDGHAGFIEEVPGKLGHYRVHDLWHHAPDYVRKRRQREEERRQKGDPVVQTATRQTVTGDSPPPAGQQMPTPDCSDGVAFPPAPAPAPSKTISSKPEGFDEAVNEVWHYYTEKFQKNPNLYRFTDERRRKGRARLEECLRMASEPRLENAVNMMKVCIDRLAASAFHNGDNKQERKYVDWSDHLFPSEKKLTSWLDDDIHRRRDHK
jgi:hypothetical protein